MTSAYQDSIYEVVQQLQLHCLPWRKRRSTRLRDKHQLFEQLFLNEIELNRSKPVTCDDPLVQLVNIQQDWSSNHRSRDAQKLGSLLQSLSVVLGPCGSSVLGTLKLLLKLHNTQGNPSDVDEVQYPYLLGSLPTLTQNLPHTQNVQCCYSDPTNPSVEVFTDQFPLTVNKVKSVPSESDEGFEDCLSSGGRSVYNSVIFQNLDDDEEEYGVWINLFKSFKRGESDSSNKGKLPTTEALFIELHERNKHLNNDTQLATVTTAIEISTFKQEIQFELAGIFKNPSCAMAGHYSNGLSEQSLNGLFTKLHDAFSSLANLKSHLEFAKNHTRCSTLKRFATFLLDAVEKMQTSISNTIFRTTNYITLPIQLKHHLELISILEMISEDLPLDEKQIQIISATWVFGVSSNLCSMFPSTTRFHPLFKTLLEEVSRIYKRQIDHWLADGTIPVESDLDNFFITIDTDNARRRDRKFWTDSYKVKDPKDVPDFLAPFLNLIMVAGKTTTLLRNCGSLKRPHRRQHLEHSDLTVDVPMFRPFPLQPAACHWPGLIMDLKIPEEPTDSKDRINLSDFQPQPPEIGFQSYFAEYIATKTQGINSDGVAMFFNDYNLLQMLQCLKDIYLFGDCDFAYDLSNRLFHHAANDSRGLSMLQYPSTLNSVMNDTLDQGPKRLQSLRDRISFDLVDSLPGATFTDSASPDAFRFLNISITIPWPLNMIIDDHILSSYNDLHTFLLSIHWCKYSMSQCMNLMLRIEQLNVLSPKQIRALHYYRHGMFHVCNVVSTYFSFQLIEGCWRNFMVQIKGATNIDDLHAAHVEFLNIAKTRCLLADSTNEHIQSAIKTLLTMILNFHQSLRKAIIESERKKWDRYMDHAAKRYTKFHDHVKFLNLGKKQLYWN